ncbi:MAG: hypothetical protein FJ145_24825 [Deltaproteobacteria bacterium]|nr:hypothetical protein [Deltaproteobacteria bacterium]
MPVVKALFVALFVIGFLAGSVRAQDKPKVYYGSSSKTFGYGSLWIAAKKGFLDQQGYVDQSYLNDAIKDLPRR